MLIGFFLGMIIGIVYGAWLAWNDYKMHGEPPVTVSSNSELDVASRVPTEMAVARYCPTENGEKYITIEFKEVKHEYSNRLEPVSEL